MNLYKLICPSLKVYLYSYIFLIWQDGFQEGLLCLLDSLYIANAIVVLIGNSVCRPSFQRSQNQLSFFPMFQLGPSNG